MQEFDKKILRITANGNKFASTKQIELAGIARSYLNSMVKSGKLVKEARGIYSLPNNNIDEMAILQHSYSKGIFSHTTALYLHNLTDRTPLKYTITFPIGYHAKSLYDKNINCIYVKRSLWNLGITRIENHFGEIVKTYNKERTICDIIKKRNSLDIQVIAEAIKAYISGTDKNLLLLYKYAKLFRVEKPLRTYLEVLL